LLFSSAHAINGNSEKTKVAWPEVLEKSKTPQKLKNHEDDSKSTSETPDCPESQPLIGWRLPGTCRDKLGLRLKTHDCPDRQPFFGWRLKTGHKPGQSLINIYYYCFTLFSPSSPVNYYRITFVMKIGVDATATFPAADPLSSPGPERL
jgi:hypothetical protein